jgi:hypothetical protein
MRPAPLALSALFLSAAFAVAGTPEEDYLAARDAAAATIKKIEAKKPDADASKVDRKALADLDKRLQAIIGGLSAKPYPAKGKITLESLSENDIGAGALDGLRFAKGDNGEQAIVTTDGLLTKWLSKPEEWWTKKRKTPFSIDEALAQDEFYTYAVGPDAAFAKTADIPIKAPEGATFAVAMLGGFAQDIGPNPEQQIVLALRKGGKVYIASEAAKKAKPIPACDAVWKEAEKKADELFKKYQASNLKDEKSLNDSNALQEKGDRDYRACYAERAPGEAFFAALTKEAQEIADRFKGP